MDATEQLSQIANDQQLSKEQQYKKFCELSFQLVPNANRISLWRFEDNDQKITCLMGKDLDSNEFWSGISLYRKDFPAYFESIVENEVINASDARNHSATRCFNDAYFEPNSIYSLLDFILHKDFRPIGVICCERTGSRVEWTANDIDQLRQIATFISFFSEI